MPKTREGAGCLLVPAGRMTTRGGNLRVITDLRTISRFLEGSVLSSALGDSPLISGVKVG